MIGGDSMLKALKSYWAFTNHRYKFVMLVLVPILLVAININVYRYEIGIGFESFLFLYWIDRIAHNHFMNGFYPKGNRVLGFMQSSPKFKRTMREVVVVDAVIRVMFYHIPYITLLMCAQGDAEALEFCSEIWAKLSWCCRFERDSDWCRAFVCCSYANEYSPVHIVRCGNLGSYAIGVFHIYFYNGAEFPSQKETSYYDTCVFCDCHYVTCKYT